MKVDREAGDVEASPTGRAEGDARLRDGGGGEHTEGLLPIEGEKRKE